MCPSTRLVEQSQSRSYSTMLASAQDWPTVASLYVFEFLEWEIDACGVLLSTLLSDEATQVFFFGIGHSKIPLRGSAADTKSINASRIVTTTRSSIILSRLCTLSRVLPWGEGLKHMRNSQFIQVLIRTNPLWYALSKWCGLHTCFWRICVNNNPRRINFCAFTTESGFV